ncbi:MAG: response regulator transcription factor [Saprospiraceae bacterium]|nr:response regulator transcription factor [Saprospiraceae bacterium]
MKCLIVDDDQLICDLLEHFCSKADEIGSVTTTNSGFESVNLINQNTFDVIFLDYNLPDITGKEILPLVPDATAVVMITSNKEFAATAYNYDKIVDYLVKPFDFTRFFRSVQQAQKFLSETHKDPDHLFVRDGTKLTKIQLSQILYCKSEANYVAIVSSSRRVLTLMTLKDLVRKLPRNFQRVHRSYIVNIGKVDSIEGGALRVGQQKIPVSSSYEKELLEKINLLN